MIQEREHLVTALKASGIRSQIYTTMKQLKQCSEFHVAGILQNGESFTRNGSKRNYEDQEGHRKKRVKLYDRETRFKVVIADSKADKVEEILTAFLLHAGKGLAVRDNWVRLTVGEADWVEEGDSVLKAKVAVEVEVTFEGGIYMDQDVQPMKIGGIVRKET